MSDPLALVYEFEAQLDRFGDEVENGAEKVLRESARVAARAITDGNEYGPGAPEDTGWLRSSFAAGINEPVATATERPKTALQQSPVSKYLRSEVAVKSGQRFFTQEMDLVPIERAVLGDTIYLTTATEYGQYLEFQPKTRRGGEFAGQSTEFLAPVEARFEQIVQDAATRVGYGATP